MKIGAFEQPSIRKEENMIVARPINEREPCLLEGNRYKDFYLYDLDGNLVVRQNPPYEGWTYDALELVSESLTTDYETLQFGWDAYLGDKKDDCWVGSSEV
ncbi:MAG: hypothetical protein V7722_10065 [Porticoccus sp.]